ncbi:hypothetical protein [Desulfogranum japonicum]|uniref:hypothetical protein n=1 Tax=Desulfogranum japonicum TaxID=231447 RepID=UPI00041FAC6A|nr:hypothetical protein [Desulfogranum japonicum]
MKGNTYTLIAVVLLVTALSFLLKNFVGWGITEKPIAWWGIFIAVPIYTTGAAFLVSWKKGKKKKALYLLQACLFCVLAMVGTFYPPFWGYSYIAFILVVALHFFLLAKVKGDEKN